MTIEATKPVLDLNQDKKQFDRVAAALEDLFSLGYTRSDVYTIYHDEESGKKITVQFRNLLPHEIREVADEVNKRASPVSQLITEQMETLARAVVCVNDMPLVLTSDERELFKKEHRREASSFDMARIIMYEKIKSTHVLDAMYDAYQEFIKTIDTHFDEIKKKLSHPQSSSLNG